jgi:hypothetical protein
LVSLAFLLVVSATAKEKDKVVLPADVLKAESVLIVIMPAAGEPLADPLPIARLRKMWRRR